ncbi:hypothetical protein BROC_02038 [Candidatus Brocadiaceae bacterium]|nr:hypothetical protein BROC_02038 [Candidatus Brocadiaceae bacterium]
MRQFDYNTISDAILHLRYTAREGGALLKQNAQRELNDFIRIEGQQGIARVFSLRHEFSKEWYRFLNPQSDSAKDQTLTMDIGINRFPFLFRDKSINIDSLELLVKVKPEFAGDHNESTLKQSLEAGGAVNELPLAPWNGLLRAEKKPAGSPGNWILTSWLGLTVVCIIGWIQMLFRISC